MTTCRTLLLATSFVGLSVAVVDVDDSNGGGEGGNLDPCPACPGRWEIHTPQPWRSVGSKPRYYQPGPDGLCMHPVSAKEGSPLLLTKCEDLVNVSYSNLLHIIGGRGGRWGMSTTGEEERGLSVPKFDLCVTSPDIEGEVRFFQMPSLVCIMTATSYCRALVFLSHPSHIMSKLFPGCC